MVRQLSHTDGMRWQCRRMKIYDNKIKRDNEAKNRSKDNQVNLPE